MARELGLPLNPYAACERFLSDKVKTITADVGLCHERYFIMRAEVGLHAEVIQDANREMKDKYGWGAYWLSGLSHYTDPKTFHATLEIDGQTEKFEDLVTLFISNANTLNFAGRPLEDRSEVSSGKLYLVIVRERDIASIPKMVVALKEAVTETETLECREIESIKIEADPAQSIIVDGETAGTTPVEINVVPAAITLLI
jgi:diacylglycerol kinase family enzyme